MFLEVAMSALRNMSHALLISTCLALATAVPAKSVLAEAPVAEKIDDLVKEKDGRGLLKAAKRLRTGTAVSKDDPLKVPDFAGARRVLEAAIALQPDQAIEAKLLLAKMLLSGEGGTIDIERALVLLADAAQSGNAAAAYLRGQQLALRPDRQEEARESFESCAAPRSRSGRIRACGHTGTTERTPRQ
jgi:TPR repeat protein